MTDVRELQRSICSHREIIQIRLAQALNEFSPPFANKHLLGCHCLIETETIEVLVTAC